MTSQHLPTYRRWKNRALAGGPTPEAFGTLLTLREHGFPDSVGRPFLYAAVTLKSALLTKVLGKAVPELNTDGGSSTDILTNQNGIALTISAGQSMAGSGWKAGRACR